MACDIQYFLISGLKGEIANLKTELRKVKDDNSLLTEQVLSVYV